MSHDIETQRDTFSWISPKLELKQSHIEGLGYFATEKIKKDEKIIVQSGRCVHVSDIDTASMEPHWYYGFQIEHDIYCYPISVNDNVQLDGVFRINHSCSPNAGFNGQITLVAIRDIEAGEEITYDYAMTDVETDLEATWVPETCRCGNDNCRKEITGSDWKMPELQKNYDGYFSTHVSKAISKTTPESDTL